MDSVYDDESDGDIDAMPSQPRSASRGLPDVKTAIVQQYSHLSQRSVLPKVSDPAIVTDDMLDLETGDSPAGTRASENVSDKRMGTADQVNQAENGFDRWEMDTGMDTSEDNMYLGQVPSSRLGSQVHASPSYDPRQVQPTCSPHKCLVCQTARDLDKLGSDFNVSAAILGHCMELSAMCTEFCLLQHQVSCTAVVAGPCAS